MEGMPAQQRGRFTSEARPARRGPARGGAGHRLQAALRPRRRAVEDLRDPQQRSSTTPGGPRPLSRRGGERSRPISPTAATAARISREGSPASSATGCSGRSRRVKLAESSGRPSTSSTARSDKPAYLGPVLVGPACHPCRQPRPRPGRRPGPRLRRCRRDPPASRAPPRLVTGAIEPLGNRQVPASILTPAAAPLTWPRRSMAPPGESGRPRRALGRCSGTRSGSG